MAINEIRETVLAGNIGPGERIDETTIARRLDISRASLREALYHLSAERLLERRPNYGTFVRKFSTREAKDLFLVRLQLEPLAAGLAATRITQEAVHQLEGIAKQLGGLDLRSDPAAALRFDAEFHLRVLEASGNDVLLQILRMVSSQVQLLIMQFGSKIVKDWGDPLQHHDVLLQALKSQNREKAETAARDHIARVFRMLFGENFE